MRMRLSRPLTTLLAAIVLGLGAFGLAPRAAQAAIEVNVNRGDVVLTYFPFASGTGGTRRPALAMPNRSAPFRSPPT